jgi:hypothetical protein
MAPSELPTMNNLKFASSFVGSTKLHRPVITAIVVAILMLAGWQLYLARPVLITTASISLWGSEDDAAREGTTFPGPAIPVTTINSGARLRILWTVYGKYYRAYFVVGPSWKTGWIRDGQDGVSHPGER